LNNIKTCLVGKQGNGGYGITRCVYSIWNSVIVLRRFWDQSSKEQSAQPVFSTEIGALFSHVSTAGTFPRN